MHQKISLFIHMYLQLLNKLSLYAQVFIHTDDKLVSIMHLLDKLDMNKFILKRIHSKFIDYL